MTAKIILISKFFLQSVFLVLLATNSAWAGDFQCTRINEGYEELFPKHIKLAYTDWKPKSKESSSIINYKNGQKIQLTKNGKLVVVGFANGTIRYNCDKNSMDVINAPKVKKTSDLGVCQSAVKNGMWDRRQEYLIYVQEAKERGLGCGVSLQGNVRKVTEVSSTDKRWWLWPRPWTPNQAAFVSGQLLKMGGEINSATGAISDVPVANGFLNMDKHGVVTYIGAPDPRYRGPYEHLITSASTTQKDPGSVVSKASNPDNDEVVNGMISDAKKLAKASPGKCVDIFPDEVNQKGADYKLVYLPNRKFKSFKSMDACFDYMLAFGKTGTSSPEMTKRAEIVLVERLESENQTPLFKRCLRANSSSDPVLPYDCFLRVYTGWLESQVPDWKTNMTDPGILLREPITIVNLSREMILKGAISIEYAEKLTIERLMNSDTALENWHQGHLALEAKQRAEKFRGFLNAIVGFGIASGKISPGIPSGAFGGGDPAMTGSGTSRLLRQNRGLYGLECSYCCRGGRQYTVVLQANDICPATMN